MLWRESVLMARRGFVHQLISLPARAEPVEALSDCHHPRYHYPMPQIKPLRGTRITSLALNLPGPAALMRLKTLGASCTKIESPAGDPMKTYSKAAYDELHQSIKTLTLDLKTERGMAKLHQLLATTDVLLTSFRPSALARLGLGWKAIHKAHPKLNLVSLVGDTAAPEIPGHDLTYMAEHGLITGTELPPTLFADMGGSLLAVEAVLAAVIQQKSTGRSSMQTLGLSQAAQYLALPRHWGLTTPGGIIGGAHALYQVMPCKDGRVAIAALESHFAKNFAQLVGQRLANPREALSESLKKKTIAFIKRHSCKDLSALADQHDLPIHVIPN